MMKCDWCAIEHDTMPVALGYTVTGEIVDADICHFAMTKMLDFIERHGRVGIYRYGKLGLDTGMNLSLTFHCDVIQA